MKTNKEQPKQSAPSKQSKSKPAVPPNTGRDNPGDGGGTQKGINKESAGPTGFGRGKIVPGNQQTASQGLAAPDANTGED